MQLLIFDVKKSAPLNVLDVLSKVAVFLRKLLLEW